jgi:trans-aconitate 2-methyltransferase
LPLLRARFPEANILGIDRSPAMLERAKGRGADELCLADAATWAPSTAPQLIYSNAALHWIDDHQSLFPRLVGLLDGGGVLAVQMPRNHDRPTHRAIAETVREGPWSAELEPILGPRERPVWPPERYHALISPLVADLDVWEVDYLHRLEGRDAIVEWTKGSALRPFLDALDEAAARSFLDAYRRRVEAAYRIEPDGSTLLRFRRLFFVATR